MPTRRDVLVGGGGALLTTAVQPQARAILASLGESYQVPEWFRDAKFGIWSHWGPQCVPEFGDWYGRLMYVQERLPWIGGETPYEHHLKHYGHPSRTGFLDIIGRWKTEAWQPEYLLRRYRQAGARYIMSMANHHDNLDNFDSAHHEWNTLRVGPKRDIVGTWEKLVREAGLRFGVSNHSSHAWHWWQTAYGYDAQGPMKGRRYDAYWLRKHHGRGTWWEGLDPQELYTGPSFVPPDGIDSAEAMMKWHEDRDGQWIETAPPNNSQFVRKWMLRQQDLVEKYRPDIVYLDNHGLPFGQTGIDAVAHYYAKAREWDAEVVLTAKRLTPEVLQAIVESVERSHLADIQPRPWQTDTCIGNWHYDRRLYERGGYKSAKEVVQRLADVVAKNGNLLLSIPQRGDGSIDEKEERILDGLAAWFALNGEAIYGSRPWRVFGEGPTMPPVGNMNESEMKPFVAEDLRFTTRGGTLYMIFLDWPEREAAIKALGRSSLGNATVERASLLGGPQVEFRCEPDALRLRLPRPDNGRFVPVVRIEGRGIA